MKVIFKKEDLVKALDIVQRAAQNKVTSNTNNGIYIKAAGSTAEFQANDYSIAIKTSCSASVEEEGDIVTASPRRFPHGGSDGKCGRRFREGKGAVGNGQSYAVRRRDRPAKAFLYGHSL